MSERRTPPRLLVVGRRLLTMGLGVVLATMTLTGLVAAFVLLSGAAART